MIKCENTLQNRVIYGGLLLIIFASVAIRFPLLEVPLERDEGEYAYAGQLILQGIPPYKLMYSMKLPGIYGIYALILAIFGQSHKGIHLGLLLFNTATIMMIFFLVKRLFNPIAGISSAACFALLSVGQSVQGIFANSEHFVIFFALCSALFLLNGIKTSKMLPFFWSGIFASFCFLVKQHGASFIAFGLIMIISQKYKNSNISLKCILYQESLFITGAVLPYLFTLIFLYQSGVFDKFWFWTVEYAMTYTTLVSPAIAWKLFFNNMVPIIKSAPAIWIISTIGLIVLLTDKKIKQNKKYLILFSIFSFLAICPGLYFRPHYFILLLPAVSILFGFGIHVLSGFIGKTGLLRHKNSLSILVVLVCILSSFYQQRIFLFQISPRQASRNTYGLNPFPESLELQEIIKKITHEEDRIVVLGSEPQIYFYSKRRAATGYVYMYPLMEQHDFARQMQIEMIQEIEKASPELLIFVNIFTSWLQHSKSPRLVFEWLNGYQTKHYKILGLIEPGMDKTNYQWVPDINWPPKSNTWLLIMKRKPNQQTNKKLLF